MSKRFSALLVVLLASVNVAFLKHAAAPSTSVSGVWAFVSETDTETGKLIRDDTTWTGIWAFSGRYHALARMENKREQLTPHALSALSPADQVRYYRQLTRISSTAGTYSVAGAILRRQWDISFNPELKGKESVGNFVVSADRFVVDLPRRSPEGGPATRVVYRRLEAAPEAPSSPQSIIGVWQFVSEMDGETGQVLNDRNTLDALWMFTEGYYVVARMTKDRYHVSRTVLDRMSPEEQVKYFRQLTRYTSTAGQYTARDGILKRTWQVSNGPDLVAQESVGRYSVQGDLLHVELPRRSRETGATVRLVYRRME